jgi:Cyclic nucleotide-binding domain
MRYEQSVTAITWLPFSLLDALPNLPIGIAAAHYDEPPPEVLGDLDELREADRFREANELRAWIEVEGGRIVDYGRDGRALLGGAGLDLGADQLRFPAIAFPVIRPEPEIGDGWARFVQTVGARIGLPAPRPVRGLPYFHIGSAAAWTTLELVIFVDGSSEQRLVSASPFPRHSVYGPEGVLLEEHGLKAYDEWYREASLDESPWSGSELDDELDKIVLSAGAKLARRRLAQGETLVKQGERGCDMFLLLEGVLAVEINGETVAEVGPGALLGELAILGNGRRTATLRALGPSRVAVLAETDIAGTRLAALSAAARAA